ncbi:hypothetical protein CEE60_02760 [Stenotrophomonas maltophilia]|uniref:Uncharacterized protein n=1 Tax=Stenotrophomonas maltophilia TaxID=40324 RepID=A0A246HSB2_STEMA|nr:hypothetical protein [Stenotrophomonas maltophilia]OWQ56412.1 hypothetical protein CEE60_02760 [Stenotrophomonas maltophilia]
MSRTIKVLGVTLWPTPSRRLAQRLRAVEADGESLRSELNAVKAHCENVDSAAGSQITSLSSQLAAVNGVLIEVQGRLPPLPKAKKAKAKAQVRRRSPR